MYFIPDHVNIKKRYYIRTNNDKINRRNFINEEESHGNQCMVEKYNKVIETILKDHLVEGSPVQKNFLC